MKKNGKRMLALICAFILCVGGICLSARVIDLAEDLCSVAVDSLCHLSVAGDHILLIDPGDSGISARIGVDRIVFRDDEPIAAFGFCLMVADILLCGISACVTHVGHHCRNGKSVLDLYISDVKGLCHAADLHSVLLFFVSLWGDAAFRAVFFRREPGAS